MLEPFFGKTASLRLRPPPLPPPPSSLPPSLCNIVSSLPSKLPPSLPPWVILFPPSLPNVLPPSLPPSLPVWHCSNLLCSYFKQQTIRDLVKLRHQQDLRASFKRDSDEVNSLSSMGTSAILLPFSITAPVMQKMIGLILGMDSLTSVDVFLITCKVNYFDVVVMSDLCLLGILLPSNSSKWWRFVWKVWVVILWTKNIPDCSLCCVAVEMFMHQLFYCKKRKTYKNKQKHTYKQKQTNKDKQWHAKKPIEYVIITTTRGSLL